MRRVERAPGRHLGADVQEARADRDRRERRLGVGGVVHGAGRELERRGLERSGGRGQRRGIGSVAQAVAVRAAHTLAGHHRRHGGTGHAHHAGHACGAGHAGGAARAGAAHHACCARGPDRSARACFSCGTRHARGTARTGAAHHAARGTGRAARGRSARAAGRSDRTTGAGERRIARVRNARQARGSDHAIRGRAVAGLRHRHWIRITAFAGGTADQQQQRPDQTQAPTVRMTSSTVHEHLPSYPGLQPRELAAPATGSGDVAG